VKNIYCISGLGADEKVFSHLDLSGYRLCGINWLPPGKNESLPSYAMRMRAEIPEADPVILGLSFGGMLGIEMAKQATLSKLILVSAPKTFHEIPRWMRVCGSLRLHKIIPLRSTRLTEIADNRRMGNLTVV
jgi:pimeloyl-ACP methyl ester carboxylesterase